MNLTSECSYLLLPKSTLFHEAGEALHGEVTPVFCCLSNSHPYLPRVPVSQFQRKIDDIFNLTDFGD